MARTAFCKPLLSGWRTSMSTRGDRGGADRARTIVGHLFVHQTATGAQSGGHDRGRLLGSSHTLSDSKVTRLDMLTTKGEGPRSRGAGGVGDVAGERGARPAWCRRGRNAREWAGSSPRIWHPEDRTSKVTSGRRHVPGNRSDHAVVRLVNSDLFSNEYRVERLEIDRYRGKPGGGATGNDLPARGSEGAGDAGTWVHERKAFPRHRLQGRKDLAGEGVPETQRSPGSRRGPSVTPDMRVK